jgi:DNA polymerase-3 subunit gamma/tau
VSPIAFRAPAPPPPLPKDLTPDEDFDFDAVDAEFAQDDIRVEHEPEPTPPAAPELPARPRLGLGSFADLRGASAPPAADGAPAAFADDNAPSAAPPQPDLPPLVPSDRRASFAEVAQAVDDASRPADSAPAGPSFADAEDFLPQRLPKRGRKSSRLETPWVRERPAVSAPPPASLANPLPAQNGATAWNGGADAATNSTPPPANGSAPAPSAAATPSADGGDRYAFFAAFRAAAEQAREEAGIDDRRGS